MIVGLASSLLPLLGESDDVQKRETLCSAVVLVSARLISLRGWAMQRGCTTVCKVRLRSPWRARDVGVLDRIPDPGTTLAQIEQE
jgi:hypothetical protein